MADVGCAGLLVVDTLCGPMAALPPEGARHYPARRGFDDIAILCTHPDVEFGWSAVTFPEERFVWLPCAIRSN